MNTAQKLAHSGGPALPGGKNAFPLPSRKSGLTAWQARRHSRPFEDD